MKHTLYNSIDEMIQPDTLGELAHTMFTATRLAPFQGVGWSASGSKFLAVHTTNWCSLSQGSRVHRPTSVPMPLWPEFW